MQNKLLMYGVFKIVNNRFYLFKLVSASIQEIVSSFTIFRRLTMIRHCFHFSIGAKVVLAFLPPDVERSCSVAEILQQT